jgi:penicillin-binding protein 1A
MESQPTSNLLRKFSEVLFRPLTLDLFNPKSKHFWLIRGLSLGVGGSTIALVAIGIKISSELPKSVDDLASYARKETLTIKAKDNVVLQEIGHVTHDKVNIDRIPKTVRQAFIASEDRRFYEHAGVDFQGIIRAIFSNFRAKGLVQGGSTITQQLARIVFLNQERSIDRKLKEAIVAHNIENRFEKQQILENYLNLVYLGSGAYGVADAAWLYFSKPVDQLTLPEAATLAAIVPGPSVYSPLVNKEFARERRNVVLQKMQEEGFISPAEADGAIASPLAVKPSHLKRFNRIAPYFTDYILKELPKHVSPEQLQAGGIVVETTLNSKWQSAAETAVDRAIVNYGKWQRFQQAALVAIDPRTGEIKAMVGGRDFGKHQFNRVTQAQRQPGSTFKTFVYSTAIAAGFSPYKSYLDAEYVIDGYKPENYGDKYRHKEVSLYDALRSSINIVALRTLLDVGWKPTIDLAHKMGIQSKLQSTYSLALGASEVNLLELTSAYGTLANKGTHQSVYGIARILDRRGKVLYQAKSSSQKALDKETSSIMTWMLQSVVNGGTGTPAQIGRSVAGKTGTSDKARDLWFVGYIPQLVAGVWLGNDDNQPTNGTSAIAAVTWRRFMLEAVKGMPIESFPPRPSLNRRHDLIKAEPIKPRRSYYDYKEEPENQSAANSTNSNSIMRNSTSTRLPRRKRLRSYLENTQPQRTTRRRRRRLSTTTRSTAPQATQAIQTPAPEPILEKPRKGSESSSESN